LGWKSLKAFLEHQKGVVCRSPKDCFRTAYELGVIDYDEFWLKLVDDRNETVHTYNEELAERIYSVLPEALKHFDVLLGRIEEQK
jgi:nucleotidyltransferase substrate binding protein (TIGR01987 family)